MFDAWTLNNEMRNDGFTNTELANSGISLYHIMTPIRWRYWRINFSCSSSSLSLLFFSFHKSSSWFTIPINRCKFQQISDLGKLFKKKKEQTLSLKKKKKLTMLWNVICPQKFLDIILHLIVASRYCLLYVGEYIFVRNIIFDASK